MNDVFIVYIVPFYLRPLPRSVLTAVSDRQSGAVGEDREAPIIHFETRSDDPVSRYRKLVERTNEIKECASPSVPSTGFP